MQCDRSMIVCLCAESKKLLNLKFNGIFLSILKKNRIICMFFD